MGTRLQTIIFVFLSFLWQLASSNITSSENAPTGGGFGMRFRLPFIEMRIQNVTDLKIIKDVAGQQVFLLHGTEFYRLILENENKQVNLIANLAGSVQESDILGAEIISWRHLFILVVALEEHLEVYQIANKTVMQDISIVHDEMPLEIDPVQQITLHGSFKKILLCISSEDSVSLVVLANFNKLYSRLNFYEWSKTYFDPIQEETITPVNKIKLIGSDKKYLITGRRSRSQNKVTVTVYNISPSLKQIQVMQLASKTVHPFTYQENNYLLSCSTSGRKKCTSFKMLDEQFTVYRKQHAAQVNFTHFAVGEHFLVGEKDNRVSVYLDTRMECYGTFKAEASEISSIFTHANEQEGNFIVLNSVVENLTLLRFIEIEFERRASEYRDDQEEIGDALKQHRHAFEENIAKLRKILLSQKYSFDEIKKTIQSQLRNVVFKNPLRILSGNIGIVQIHGSKVRSPMQILQKLETLSSGERRTRFSRGFADDVNMTSTLTLNVKNLRVGNLIYEGDLIPGFNLSQDGLHLKISKPVTTQILQTKELLTATLVANRKPRKFFTRSFSELTTNYRSLSVNRINGMLWDDFFQNLFLRSQDRSLSGRLILQSNVQIGSLKCLVLNELPTESLFNLVQPQNITSDIVISRFFVSDLRADLLNGLDFARDIARKGVENIINSPVVAQDVSIINQLILAEKDHQARHIFGTSVLDFQQTYTGKVVIEGSLTLANVFLEDQQKTKIFVDEKEVSSDLQNHFWMHSIPQVFENSILLTDCTVTAPSLNTVYLNSLPVTDYLLTTDQKNLKPILLIFLSANIEGNLIADPKIGTKLRTINESAVKVSDHMIVSGEKNFQGRLALEGCEIMFLNHISANDLVSIDQKSVIFTGNKTFKSIHITEAATITKHLEASLINGALPTEQEVGDNNHFGTVVLSSKLKAKNLNFQYLNGFSSKKIFKSIRSLDKELLLNKDLYVEGSIEFGANLYVETINNIDWEDYQKSLVRTNENTVIKGRKKFSSDLIILTELRAPKINDIPIDNLFENVLLKSQHQVITGAYTFDTVRLNNINAPSINDLSASAFIDTRSQKVIFNSDIVLKKLIVQGNLFGGVDIDLSLLESRIKAIIHKPWKNLHVLGNAHWPWGYDQQSLDLQYLFANAVRHLDDQIITGNVKLKKPLISTMKTKEIFPKDIDFDHIASDCLFHNSSMEEVVKATKVFLKPVQFAEVTAMGHLGSRSINRVDVLLFNESLYRLSSPQTIYGSLIFEYPPIFGHLTVEGLVNLMPTDNIFFAHNGNPWPPVKMNKLKVEGDLKLVNIDHMSLDFLLKNRVRKSGMAQEVFGHLTFEHLVLQKDIYIQSINGISIDNVVQKIATSLQEINGVKIIEGNLNLIGPAMVSQLNNEDLTDRYQKTIFIDKNYKFDKLSVANVTFRRKLIANSSTYNKSPIADLLQNKTYQTILQTHTNTLKNIELNLKMAEEVIDSKVLNAKRLVYLDYDFSTVVEWKLRNDSIQEQFIFDNNRYQYCDKEQTIIKWSRYHNRISLNKITTNIVTTDQYGVRVIAENFCKENFRNVNSRITITDPNFTKRFALNQLVHSIEVYYASELFVMIHAIDLYAGNNEIRFLKIDNNLRTIQDWQLLTDGVGKVSRLFKLQSHTILVVSTIIENYPSITIYSLNADTQIFEVIQVIDGDYDIIELAQATPHSYHLFLSCVHCQRIVIFEYDSLTSTECHMYHIYQIIKLKTRIDRFNLFTLSDGGIYLLVLSDQDIDFYHIYKYQYIQGWKHFTYGYFKNIQSAYPLLKDGISSVDDNLLLLCNRKCTLVKAFYQL